MIRDAAVVAVFCLLARAENPLQNTGAPMQVRFTCTEDDSREGGLTCSDQEPCAVYLELSGADIALNKLLIAGNLHTKDATLYSILLASEDGGRSWTEPYERIRFAALDQVQFIDFERGWISGAILQGVPRDPFFLVTVDAGKTWQSKPIFEESRTGVPERFWFDSAASGKLLIATKLKHELYETMTGGESWALRQTSTKPIAFPSARAGAETSVRLRPNSKIHGYDVEKRQGDKWVNAAAFLVDAGKCTN